MAGPDRRASLRLAAQRLGAGLGWALALWLVVLSTATAQSTGGSAGGSSWGSSSSGGGGGGGSWSSSSGGYDSGAAAANSYEPPVWAQLAIAAAFLVFLYFLFRWILRLSEPSKVGVSVVRVAIDARARRFVQESLAKLARESDTATRGGLADLLSSASRALVASRLAWSHCSVEHLAPMPAAQARSKHTHHANDARSRFQAELVRAADGTTRTAEASGLVAREHEGDGVVVVTLVIATHAKLRAASPTRPDEVEQLLTQLAQLAASELLAVEIVWSPAAEADRMSTDELETRYPELTRLSAVAGRVFCRYCGGPHTAELAKCPHCGAPATSDAAPAAH